MQWSLIDGYPCLFAICGVIRKYDIEILSQDLLEVLMQLIYLKRNSPLRTYGKIYTIWQQRWRKEFRED
jgi:hypothetical protein